MEFQICKIDLDLFVHMVHIDLWIIMYPNYEHNLSKVLIEYFW